MLLGPSKQALHQAAPPGAFWCLLAPPGACHASLNPVAPPQLLQLLGIRHLQRRRRHQDAICRRNGSRGKGQGIRVRGGRGHEGRAVGMPQAAPAGGARRAASRWLPILGSPPAASRPGAQKLAPSSAYRKSPGLMAAPPTTTGTSRWPATCSDTETDESECTLGSPPRGVPRVGDATLNPAAPLLGLLPAHPACWHQ